MRLPVSDVEIGYAFRRMLPPIVSETLNVLGDHPEMAEQDSKSEFDRRKAERAEVDEVAFISVAGSSTRCQIVNISSDGAAVDVPDAAYIPGRFRLMTERDRAIRNCRIAWISKNRIGVEFEASSEDVVPMTHRDRQFLQYLRGGDWRRATSLPDSQKLISKLLLNGWIERSGSGHELAYRITPRISRENHASKVIVVGRPNHQAAGVSGMELLRERPNVEDFTKYLILAL